MQETKHLIDYFVPANYRLTLQSNTSERSFAGEVAIQGAKGEKFTDTLYLHCKDLEVHVISINDKNLPFTIDEKTEEIHIEAPANLKDNFTLTVNFAGKIGDDMTGAYVCPYIEDGKEKIIIGTQFESHYARKVFPCIDEPAAKATFDLILSTPKGEKVVSNTQVKHQKSDERWTTSIFETTPKMSTYLLAYAHGDFATLEATTEHGVLVRTFTTPQNIEYTRHSLEVAVKTLDFLDDYFDEPYPLSKCDLVGLPNFSAGAMENWGCITFREASFFVDPDNTSQTSLEYVTMTVVHELVHQWFGNLVTMKWWNDLWLNEGFASFMPYIVMDELFPEWDVWTQFILEDFMGAQGLDALANSHPIEVKLDNPDEIRTIFDSISYDKGASVLRMLHGYIGAENFREGLRLYLNRHKYGNTVTADLWQALSEVSKKPVAEFMHAWTTQTGFPVLTVTQSEDKLGLELSQERYFINARERKKNKEDVVWPLPLSIVGSKEQSELSSKATTWEVPTKLHNTKLNAEQSGFYMVAYTEEHIAKLAKQVESGKLGVRDRIGLLNDTFELAKGGYTSTKNALTLLESYRDETNPFVWDTIAGELGSIRLVMDSDELRDKMKPFVRNLIGTQLLRVGWDKKIDEPYFDTIMRPTLLSLGVFSEHPFVIDEAKKRFKSMKKPSDNVPDTRGTIYGTAAHFSSQADYGKLLTFYQETDSPQEKVKLTAALCGFKEKDQIKQNLARIKSSDVKTQDVPYWIAYTFLNRHAREEAWKWFKKEWPWLVETFSSELTMVAHYILYAGRVHSSDVFAEEFKAFFTNNAPVGTERQVKQALESIEWHADWKARDEQEVLEFF